MNEFKVGDLVKVKGENIVFPIQRFSDGLEFPDSEEWVTRIPEDWLISTNGSAFNPDKCELYKGAVSVFVRGENEGVIY